MRGPALQSFLMSARRLWGRSPTWRLMNQPDITQTREMQSWDKRMLRIITEKVRHHYGCAKKKKPPKGYCQPKCDRIRNQHEWFHARQTEQCKRKAYIRKQSDGWHGSNAQKIQGKCRWFYSAERMEWECGAKVGEIQYWQERNTMCQTKSGGQQPHSSMTVQQQKQSRLEKIQSRRSRIEPDWRSQRYRWS